MSVLITDAVLVNSILNGGRVKISYRQSKNENHTMTLTDRLSTLPTPSLVLDEKIMLTNIARLRDRPELAGITLRPHLKTAKSVGVARRLLTDGTGPATVSTLREAEVFFESGIRDILYAVGIAPQKLPRVVDLIKAGCGLTVLLDSMEQAQAVVDASRASGVSIPALLEVDSDGHRSGLPPTSPALIAIGRVLHDGGGLLRGVLTHAGESYGVAGASAHAAFAEQERSAAVIAADNLRQAGLPCPVVSVGSTPTAHAARNLAGVTEMRAGVYVFFDLVMAGIGVCRTDDIALSVLTTVIGHQAARGWIMVDAGWMALSRDRGTANQAVDQGYGLVCDDHGKIIPDLIVTAANQEHGIIALRPGSGRSLPDLPVGTRLRILPNHACATAGQFDSYHVIPAQADAPLSQWSRFGGW
ncbi:D-threo-3-hydroxyaspartate dehydratase [Dickeya solani]|uniref:Alanine racemase-like protein n=2 Tax=Dickeya solani TaxID=1089444 RepID=A0AAV3KAN4_9GAMM|nr:D-threo-3-hydroxyaspartate dehydratase [Dickeya solani]ERO57843.1 Alanine racemase-like protein [Dickeya solani D s0432-1]AYQ51033.1 D-threo-3-hydroxyaspartate dehydratase [Dickeya solani]MBD3604501.1 alanine racemase [Dickeya solani]NUA39035.1 D-threo-3-hydroxyaspartate dehydratase [Dickeya solani]